MAEGVPGEATAGVDVFDVLDAAGGAVAAGAGFAGNVQVVPDLIPHFLVVVLADAGGRAVHVDVDGVEGAQGVGEGRVGIGRGEVGG